MVSISPNFLLKLLIFVYFPSQQCFAGNILFFQAICSYSHRLSMWPLMEDLLEAGHNVTGLSPYPMKPPHTHPKFNDYVPKLWTKQLGDWNDVWDFVEMRKQGVGWHLWLEAPKFGSWACESLYEDEEFREFVRSNKFDLVVMDHDFNECAYGLVHFWNAKLIVYSTSSVMGFFQDQFGLPDETSSISETVIGFPSDMSFKERFLNALIPLGWKLLLEWHWFPELQRITRQGLEKVTGEPVKDLPAFADVVRNTSLVFVTTHYSMSYPRSFPPNHILIGGGISGQKSPGKLPKDLEDFIGNDPFIFISLGSVCEFTKFTEEAQKQFIGAIEAFPEVKFVWKEGKEIGFKLPGNVKLVKWAPQPDLLAHENIKGFITHAGLGSITESISFGVPLVMFPIFTDQDFNADVIQSRGGGILLEITDIKRETLEGAIREILTNPSYRQAMQKLSRFFQDRPMTPRKTALWWTEFALRYEKEDIQMLLRPSSVRQSWWVKRQIDVWLLATLIAILVILVPTYILVKLTKCLMRKKEIAKIKPKTS